MHCSLIVKVRGGKNSEAKAKSGRVDISCTNLSSKCRMHSLTCSIWLGWGRSTLVFDLLRNKSCFLVAAMSLQVMVRWFSKLDIRIFNACCFPSSFCVRSKSELKPVRVFHKMNKRKLYQPREVGVCTTRWSEKTVLRHHICSMKHQGLNYTTRQLLKRQSATDPQDEEGE